MLSLSERFKSLGVKIGAANLPPPRPRAAHTIDHVLAGRLQATPYGETFVVETVYPADYRHGRCRLRVDGSLRTLADWARESRVATCAPGALVFLDTETTGLAGGTGTYAFLVGVGRYVGEEFHLRQFFMRDPSEEPALLMALSGFFQPGDALVTFNGKSFDAPLLNTRYTAQRFPSPLTAAAHLDLLPLARRLWRDRLESRALGFLETHILGAARAEEEVPGWLIPQMYFDYLRSGDARPLKGVFYHNAMDVVALAALLGHVAQLLDDPLVYAAEHGSDLVALGRLFEELGDLPMAAGLYERGLEMALSEAVLADARQRLAFLQRRQGQDQTAVALWRQAAQDRQVYAHVALAKYHEHQQRDYAEAARWTRAALALVSAPDYPHPDRARQQADLEHRLARLLRKSTGPA